MIQANQIQKGTIIKLQGALCSCLDFQHVKPGKGGAFIKAKLKMLQKGSLIEKTFRSEEKLEAIHLERRKIQYLYQDSQLYIFMEMETYEQFSVDAEFLGADLQFLIEGMELEAYFEGQEIISLIFPIFIERQVIESEPGLRGNTVTSATKLVTVQGGYKLQVPLFVNVGDAVKIDSRTGQYITRTSL